MTFFDNLIKKTRSDLLLISILFLFFFQTITDLIEAIYMLDLLKLSMDEKVLGVLFLISPIVLIFFRDKVPDKFLELNALIIIISRVISPLVNTAIRIIFAGLAVSFFMIFLTTFLYKKGSKNEEKTSKDLGIGLAIASLFSITFRSLNSTIDISTYKGFQVIGWILATIAFLSILSRIRTKSELENKSKENEDEVPGSLYLSILGMSAAFLFIYFALLSPTVISRWTEGNYILITISLSLMIASYGLIISVKPTLLQRLSAKVLSILNLIFILSIFLTIFFHIVFFPTTPNSAPVIINHPPPWFSYIPLIGMIALSPILYVDFTLICRVVLKNKPKLSQLSKGFSLGGIFFILITLIIIFTNIWGYVEPVSPIFRNLFWLPFLLVGLFIALPILNINKKKLHSLKKFEILNKNYFALIIIILLVVSTSFGVIISSPNPDINEEEKVISLRILTYNIQQGVNVSGDKNYDRQLDLIKSINPDIIGLQESDSARVSGGNSDVVRYFANKLTGLNYYSFYGPKTVTGTYGAAILSKYPIISAKTIFTYSDEDEIGTTYVQIQVGIEIFNVFVNHPAGSHEAKLAHIEGLLKQIEGKENVISMGDFNSREGTIYYEKQAAILKDVWRAKWPSGIDDNGLDMRRRIDHIFISQEFIVVEARFILDPQSDHPALWTEIKI